MMNYKVHPKYSSQPVCKRFYNLDDEPVKWLHILLAEPLTGVGRQSANIISHGGIPPKMPFIWSPLEIEALFSDVTQRNDSLQYGDGSSRMASPSFFFLPHVIESKEVYCHSPKFLLKCPFLSCHNVYLLSLPVHLTLGHMPLYHKSGFLSLFDILNPVFLCCEVEGVLCTVGYQQHPWLLSTGC